MHELENKSKHKYLALFNSMIYYKCLSTRALVFKRYKCNQFFNISVLQDYIENSQWR
jgi:hypothetical protein